MQQTSETASAPHRAPVPHFTPAQPMPGDPETRDHGWLNRWPLRSYLELGALDMAPGSARAHVGAVLREWGLGDIADDACLIVSELTTNAVAATRDADRPDPVRIWVLADTGAGVLFLVWDATMPAPVLRAPAPDAERHLHPPVGSRMVEQPTRAVRTYDTEDDLSTDCAASSAPRRRPGRRRSMTSSARRAPLSPRRADEETPREWHRGRGFPPGRYRPAHAA